MLRRATVADLDAIMAIESTTFATDAWSAGAMRSELESSHTVYLVQVEDDTVVGYGGLLAPRGGHEGDIQTIAVASDARRRGLGRELMIALLSAAAERGAREVFLEVRADNPHAQALYSSLGFEQIAVRPHYYQPDDVDAWVMKATLTAPTLTPPTLTAPTLTPPRTTP
jgi:ribosomal-protein-alanine acetyltransferase